MPSEDAERLAVEAMHFIAADTARLLRFFQMTGLTPAVVRENSQDKAILCAFLDHLMGDESLLLAFATNSQCDPSRIAGALRTLEHSNAD